MIYVIDERMGRGKSSMMINFVNSSGDNEHFLYIVPYLDEIKRIMKECVVKNFVTPEEGKKAVDIKKLLRQKKNIVATHKLFSMFDFETVQIIRSAGYTMIMDEVANTITMMDISSNDLAVMTSEYTEVDGNGKVRWTAGNYDGMLNKYKSTVNKNTVYSCSDDVWFEVMPIDMFTAFRNVYLLTYLFEHQIQRCYFNLYGIKYSNLYVGGSSQDTYHISDKPEPLPPANYKNLLHIVQDERLNAIGEKWNAMSHRWYVELATEEEKTQLRRNTYTYYRRHANTPSRLNLWTVYKDDEKRKVPIQSIMAGNGYAKGFLACTAKATNDYKDRTSLAYLCNRFPNPKIKNFLAAHDIHLDRNGFALSEMIQWIWRSAIRDDKEIMLYIPSRRMRELLVSWLDTISQE